MNKLELDREYLEDIIIANIDGYKIHNGQFNISKLSDGFWIHFPFQPDIKSQPDYKEDLKKIQATLIKHQDRFNYFLTKTIHKDRNFEKFKNIFPSTLDDYDSGYFLKTTPLSNYIIIPYNFFKSIDFNYKGRIKFGDKYHLPIRHIINGDPVSTIDINNLMAELEVANIKYEVKLTDSFTTSVGLYGGKSYYYKFIIPFIK